MRRELIQMACVHKTPPFPSLTLGPDPDPFHVNPGRGRGRADHVGCPGTMGSRGPGTVRGKGDLGKPVAWLAAGRGQARS